MDNPLIPVEVSAILAQYSPKELAVYKARGMLDSRGIPTIPPGQPINSSGMSYSPVKMTEQERANDTASYTALKSGTFWGQPNIQQRPTLTASQRPIAPLSNPASLSAEQAAALAKKPESGGNYSVGYGGADLSAAPLDEFGFPIWAGKMGPAGISHAAGAYQFEPGTWRQYAKKLGIKDFSQASQDAVFRAAYEDQGFKPWAPYNSVLRSNLASLGAPGKMPTPASAGADSSKNAGLSGQINMGPLGLPEDLKTAKDKVAEALKGQASSTGSSSLSSSMALLSLLGSYKITPITYDPWKYVPKVTLDPFEV